MKDMPEKDYVIICLILIIGLAGCTRLSEAKEAIGTMIEFSKNDKYKQRASRQETINFKKVKKDIVGKKLEPGISQEDALSRFGEPVVILNETEGQRWGYKPAQSSWFAGERIYLFFDCDNKLVNWEKIE